MCMEAFLTATKNPYRRGKRGGGHASSTPSTALLSPYCVGRTRRAKLILACMESCKGNAELDLLVMSLEESKVYDRV